MIQRVFDLRWRIRNFPYREKLTVSGEEKRFHCRLLVLKILEIDQVHIAEVEGRLNSDDACRDGSEDKNFEILHENDNRWRHAGWIW